MIESIEMGMQGNKKKKRRGGGERKGKARSSGEREKLKKTG